MYTRGDQVVYPLHGAGIIEDIVEEPLQDCELSKQTYYVLRIPIGDLKIMVCKDNASNINMRKVMPSCDIQEIMSQVCSYDAGAVCVKENWSQRYKDNMEKIKSGNLIDVASVFYSLYKKESQKSLSSAEKKMMSNVKKIILSEIILSYGVDKVRAEEILENELAI